MGNPHVTAQDDLLRDLEPTPYRFVKRLSGGAMGEVIVVLHVDLGEERVMKLIRSEYGHTGDLAIRLRTEARILTKLSHRNVVRVFDFGRTASGRPFLVMELLRGRTLRQLLVERGQLPADEVVEIGRQILSGLDKVHHLGVVHRDLKPDNVFYTDPENGEPACVKILDFGIVKVLGDHQRRALQHVAPTAEGMLVGTPAFLAPEQVLGDHVSAPADLYSVGAIMWSMLVGEPPFRRSSQLELLRAHISDPPEAPSSRLNAEHDLKLRALDAVILKALEKKPRDRYNSAEQMDQALASLDDEATFVSSTNAFVSDTDATVVGVPLLLPLLLPSSASPRLTLPAPEPQRLAPEREEPTRDPLTAWLRISFWTLVLISLVALIIILRRT